MNIFGNRSIRIGSCADGLRLKQVLLNANKVLAIKADVRSGQMC